MANRPIITLTTDFGAQDHFVGAIKGVILNIVPEASIVDISHAVHAFDVLDGALTIAAAYSYFPPGTVHMVVVDPGVGSERRAIVATNERHHFVAPDNGVLAPILSREERVRVYHATAEHYFLPKVSRTFHARDVFAPLAAHLAKGVLAEKMGEEMHDFIRVQLPQPERLDSTKIRGIVLKVDRFGNLITNLTPEAVPFLFQPNPPPFRILIDNREIRVMQTAYANAPPGEVFGILGSMGYLELAANQASAAGILGVCKGAQIEVALEG